MVTIASYLLLALGLSLLVGCATAGKAKWLAEPTPAAAAKPSPSLPTGPSVVHFTDGREGFRDYGTIQHGCGSCVQTLIRPAP